MIIDFHAHYFPDDLAERAIDTIRDSVPTMSNALNGTLTDHIRSMKENGITQSVTLPVATKEEQVSIINQIAINMTHNEIIPFGSIHPKTADFRKEINLLKNGGIKGIKLHPEYQQFMADDKKMFPLYEELTSQKMIVLFHAGKDPWPEVCKGAYPQRLKNVADNFPKLKIVAAHMGGWRMWEEVYETLASTQIYFDTSAVTQDLPPELFTKILNKKGEDKILFGSDSPWFSYQENFQYIDLLKLSDEIKDRIFYKNALNLLS